LSNLFSSDHLCRILYLKMKNQFSYVKPFLILLNVLPERLYDIRNENVIDTSLIPMDERIIDILRKL